MQIDADRLARWLETAGSAPAEDRSPTRNLAEQLYRDEVGRDADPAAEAELGRWADLPAAPQELRALVRSTLEAAAARTALLGEGSATFRLLSGAAELLEEPVAPQLIGECIATYRVLFGREPDVAGFRSFVQRRSDARLVEVLGPMIEAAEAAPFRAAGSMSVAAVCSVVTAMTPTILGVAADDIARRSTIEISAELERLGARVDGLALRIDEFIGFVRLKLGAHA